MRARDTSRTAAIRETLAAIENAEAQDTSLAPQGQSDVIAGAVRGLGAGEVARRELSPSDVAAIVERELRERREAAASYESLGRNDEADVLRRQVAFIETLAADTTRS